MPQAAPDESGNGSSWEDRAAALHDGPQSDIVNFPYQAVETDVDLFCEQMGPVKINPSQAIAILVWHRSEMASAETSSKALTIARVIGEMLASENVQLDLNSLALATGLDQALNLGSEAEVARRLGVTRAAVCKAVGKWRDTLGYSPTKFTRSEDNRRNCSEAQSKDHWRRRKPTAQNAALVHA